MVEVPNLSFIHSFYDKYVLSASYEASTDLFSGMKTRISQMGFLAFWSLYVTEEANCAQEVNP